MPLPIEVDMSHYLARLGGEPHVFHCHHYNCFLQQSIINTSAGVFDARTLLIQAATDVVAAQLKTLKADAAMAQEIFSVLGFGKLELALTKTSGTATVKASHYALAWLSKFGKVKAPVCFFPAGFVAAAAGAVHGGNWQAVETECLASGGSACRFEVKPGGKAPGTSPGMGALADFGPRPPAATKTSVDDMAIIQACAGLPLAGDKEGNVHAFGVSLTRHYSNYYNLISYKFDHLMASMGGEAAAIAARILLVEAGHVCAFHTFGGIMESAEWEALIKPQCNTLEDWAYGMVAVVNALGWGRWSIAALEPASRIEMVIDGSYESNGYIAAFGKSEIPRCHLATGATAGLMNLLYNADITKRPQLTPEFYDQTFRSPGLFVAREVECRTMGAKACRVVAEKLGA